MTSASLEAPAFQQNARLGRGVNILGWDALWQNRERGQFKEHHFKLIQEAGFQHVRINLLWAAKTASVQEAVDFQRLVAELSCLIFRPLALSNFAQATIRQAQGPPSCVLDHCSRRRKKAALPFTVLVST